MLLNQSSSIDSLVINLGCGRAAGLLHPPVLHVLVALGLRRRVKLLADVADCLMVVKAFAVEILPPEVLVELGIVRVDDLEEVGERFRIRKFGRIDVRMGRRDGGIVSAP